VEIQFGASKSHKQNDNDQNQTKITASCTFHQTPCGPDQETTTKARQELDYDLMAQEQDQNRATVTCSKQKYESRRENLSLRLHHRRPVTGTEPAENDEGECETKIRAQNQNHEQRPAATGGT
jgi:hypothetical protein